MDFSLTMATSDMLDVSTEINASAFADAAGTAAFSAAFGALGAFFATFGIFIALVGILMIVAYWMIYKKANQPGWASIIPIYNMVVLFKIVKLNPWLVLLMLIPVANVVLLIIVQLRLAKVFGKSTGFGVGLILLNVIFMPILAFDKSTYDAEKVANVE